MAQHKAATQVTIAPLSEKSFVEELVGRYWMPAAVVAVLITAWSLYSAYSAGQTQEALDAPWNELFEVEGDAAEYEALAERYADDPAGPWAQLMAVNTLAGEQEFDQASAALQELRASFPDHPLVTDPMDFGDGRPPRSLVDHLSEAIDGQRSWRSEHTELFENPPPPPDAPRVRLQTDQGDIVVALYQDEAPKHVANFLSLCEKGFYDGTRFHRVAPGFMIQGGDPNSRSEDRGTWGTGGPEEKLDPEPNQLHHFAGVLSAAKQPGESQSSGSQFFLTTNPALHLDGEHVVFGAVVEGLDVVRAIAQGAITQGTTDQPENPVTLTGTEVL